MWKFFLLNPRTCFSLTNIWFKKLDISWLDEGSLVPYAICFLMTATIQREKIWRIWYIKKIHNCMKHNIKHELEIRKQYFYRKGLLYPLLVPYFHCEPMKVQQRGPNLGSTTHAQIQRSHSSATISLGYTRVLTSQKLHFILINIKLKKLILK